MDGFSSQNTQQELATENQVVYVDELAGPDDYWLSITDASRVCRVQDVSIRRAIARKVLPVRRYRAGQNKRTRLVRASDLTEAGFPIIDESAIITQHIGKVDVLNIPLQQQQIAQEQQGLMLRLEEVQEALANHQEQVSAGLLQQQDHFQTTLQTAQEEQRRLLAGVEARLLLEQEKFQVVLAETSFRLSSEQRNLSKDMAQEQTIARAREESLQAELEVLRQTFADEQATSLSRDAHLNALQTAFLDYQREVQQRLSKLVSTQQKAAEDYVNKEIRRLELAMQEQLLTLTESVNALTLNLETQLSELGQTLTRTQQDIEDLRQRTERRAQELERALHQQQEQVNQYEQLLSLRAYAQQRLATAQDLVTVEQEHSELEARLLTAQQRELERYQPLLAFLSPERQAALVRLLEESQDQR